MRHLGSRALRFLRQTAGVFITLAVLSFFVVFMSVETRAQTYEYDKLGRVSRVIYDDRSYAVYEYDANGNLIRRAYYGNTGAAGGEKPGGGKENPKKKHRRGMRATGKYATYVITSVEERTVTFRRLTARKRTSYAIPDSVKIDGITYRVTKIADKAFKNKKSLKRVIIGKNITTIGKQAFYGCKNLKRIIFKTTKLKTVGRGALKGIHRKAVLQVPKKKYKSYKKLLKGKGQKKTVKIKKG